MNKNTRTAGKQRRSHKAKMTRIMVSISEPLLELVDQAAAKDFTTRSDVIRTALLWYVRPQGRQLDQNDPDEILNVLEKRRARRNLHDLLKNANEND